MRLRSVTTIHNNGVAAHWPGLYHKCGGKSFLPQQTSIGPTKGIVAQQHNCMSRDTQPVQCAGYVDPPSAGVEMSCFGYPVMVAYVQMMRNQRLVERRIECYRHNFAVVHSRYSSLASVYTDELARI